MSEETSRKIARDEYQKSVAGRLSKRLKATKDQFMEELRTGPHPDYRVVDIRTTVDIRIALMDTALDMSSEEDPEDDQEDDDNPLKAMAAGLDDDNPLKAMAKVLAGNLKLCDDPDCPTCGVVRAAMAAGKVASRLDVASFGEEVDFRDLERLTVEAMFGPDGKGPGFRYTVVDPVSGRTNGQSRLVQGADGVIHHINVYQDEVITYKPRGGKACYGFAPVAGPPDPA
jgi:hypothetical protein